MQHLWWPAPAPAQGAGSMADMCSRAAAENAYDWMAGLPPRAQAEVLARHYAARAVTAVQLLKMCEYLRERPDSEAAADVVDRLAEQLRADHLHDLGLPLEWRRREGEG